MSDCYYAPTRKAQPITLLQLQQRLMTAGLPCTIEPDSDGMHYLVFEPHETTLFVSTTGESVMLVALEFGMNDDVKVPNTIEKVMCAIGFSADEGDDYV